MHKELTRRSAYSNIANCPNLLEWTGWQSSFCRLRYMVPDYLTSSEVEEYCKNDNHTKCVFYMDQVDAVSQNYMVQGE